MKNMFGTKTYITVILVAMLVFASIISAPDAFAAKGNGNSNTNSNGNSNTNSNGNSNTNSNGNSNTNSNTNSNGNSNNEGYSNSNGNSEGSSVVSKGNECDGGILITNNLTLRGRCVLYDSEPPKITDVMLTPSNYLCVTVTDNIGVESVTLNGVTIPKHQGSSGTFCLKDTAQRLIVTPTESNSDGILLLSNVGVAIQAAGKEVNLVGNMALAVSDLAGNTANAGKSTELLYSTLAFGSSSAPLGGSLRHFSMLEEVEQVSYEHDTYSCYVDDGKHVITNADGKIVIKNLTDSPLKNVRMYSNTVGKPFLLDQNKISSIPAYGEITINLISKVPDSDIPLDYEGALVIAPENALPMTIPIDIR